MTRPFRRALIPVVWLVLPFVLGSCSDDDEDAAGFELGEDLSRPLAARRAIAAVMPAADRRGDAVWLAEAEPAQRVERAGVVLGAGEDEVAWSGKTRRLLEELGVGDRQRRASASSRAK